ncbi:MAG: PAS domain S-box protein [Candidatus Marinimicrobia bacterium]|nr:PAS domain S-box protein [Candidatus Neomarinimicrobiota bacterium]
MNKSKLKNIHQWLREELFQQVPFNIAVIDRNYNIIEANENFIEYFGDWKNKKCYEAYKGRFSPCDNCMSFKTFEDGLVRVTDEVGIDRHGRTSHYVGHIVPIKDEDNSIPYVIEMTTDVTETKRWQREYSILFDRAPCYIAVVDQKFRISRTNELFRNTFGDSKGKLCYEVYKHRKTKCKDCPAVKTLQDGQVHSSTQLGLTKDGKKAQYIITTSPLSRGEGKVSHIIEMAVDITEIRKLEQELAKSNILREALVNNSPFGIISMNEEDKATIINPSAYELFKLDENIDLESLDLRDLLPDEIFEITGKSLKKEMHDSTIRDLEGNEIPVNLINILLKQQNKVIGKAAFIQDLSLIKQLENDKIEAERLAAVGQTVAGLAHSVKNILMGLEGGMYMVRSGLNKGNSVRISEGWEVLERYFEKTTSMVKDFLSFSKGRLPEVKSVHPNDLAVAMIDLYGETAKKMDIILKADLGKRVKPATLDPDGIHTCLTNLISNAIDACQMSDKKKNEVTIKTREKNGVIVFEVIDTGCGIDYETKQKVFTSFFTTKGGEGTGLGLLTTRKIVYEHGGKIEMETKEGKGTTFRMEFPRDRLLRLANSPKKT